MPTTKTNGDLGVLEADVVDEGEMILAAPAPDYSGDLDADEAPVRFPDSDVLSAAHVFGLEKLHAWAMEVLSGSCGEVGVRKREKSGGAREMRARVWKGLAWLAL